MAEAKTFELFALSGFRFPSEDTPASPIQPSDVVLELLMMGRILLPPGSIGDGAAVAQEITIPVLAPTHAAILCLQSTNAALHVVVRAWEPLPVIALHQVWTQVR